MPSTYDPLLRLELQATGENATTWGIKTNNNLDLLAAAIAGSTVVSVSSGDITLSTANATADQARCAILIIEGTLTGNVNVIVPAAPKNYATLRNTTGAFSITVHNGGSGAPLSSSGPDLIICTSATCVNLVGSLAASVSTLQVQVNAVSAAVSTINANSIRILE